MAETAMIRAETDPKYASRRFESAGAQVPGPGPSLLLSAPDVARLLRVSVATVWRMRSAGRLPPAVRVSAGAIRWRRSDIEKFVQGL
jgi:predicted DNA-binding transcriptional regulator AlpA